MVPLAHLPDLPNSQALLSPLFELAREEHGLNWNLPGGFSRNDRQEEPARFHFARPTAGLDLIRLGLFEQNTRAFNLIFETPARATFTDQVAAMVAALDTLIASYHRLIAHAL